MLKSLRPSLICAVLITALFTMGAALAQQTPRLDGAKCVPGKGTAATVFHFSIACFGATEPSRHDIHLDSGIFPLKKIGAGPAGGTLYSYETKLAPGTHKYRFRFQVGTLALRKPGPTAAEWYTGPTVTGAAEKCAISGLIRANDAALAGVEVRLTQEGATIATVKTNAEGRYTFGDLKAGTYRVTPVKAGFRMDPLYRMVTVPATTMTCNFRGIKL